MSAPLVQKIGTVGSLTANQTTPATQQTATTKANFVNNTGSRQVLSVPRTARVKKGSDKAATKIKLFFYGNWGTGKSYTIVDLIKLGYKILVISTDIGGSGLLSVKVALQDREDLLETNLREIVLDNDDEVQDFIAKPEAFFPDIYDYDPDFVVWDGFSAWQQVGLSERIGAMPNISEKRTVATAVEEGLQFEQAQWGMVRNATFRAVHKFCSLNNRKTGKVWHVIITAQEGLKSKSKGDNKSELTETKMPLVQGSGGVLMGGAFDLIIRTKKEVSIDTGKTKFMYQIQSENAMSKARGFTLPNEMVANMADLWSKITTQAGIKRDAIDETAKEEQ